MNKLTKGAIAAGVGTVLLLSAGGTLAYWNDSADLAGGKITAGDLDVTQPAQGAWTLSHLGAAPTAVSIAEARIVPGDTLVYTAEFTVNASGDNLEFDVDVLPGSIAAADTADDADIALAAALTDATTTTYKVADATGTIVDSAVDTTHVAHVKAAPGTYTVTTTTTIQWAYGQKGDGNTARTGAVNLDKFTVSLEQAEAGQQN